MCAEGLVNFSDFDLVVDRVQYEVAAVGEPVDHVEDEEQTRHGHQEEPVHVDVVLPAKVPLLRRLVQVHLVERALVVEVRVQLMMRLVMGCGCGCGLRVMRVAWVVGGQVHPPVQHVHVVVGPSCAGYGGFHHGDLRAALRWRNLVLVIVFANYSHSSRNLQDNFAIRVVSMGGVCSIC